MRYRGGPSTGPAPSHHCCKAQWLQVQLVTFIEHLARWCLRLEWCPNGPVPKVHSLPRNQQGLFHPPDTAAAHFLLEPAAVHEAIMRCCRLLYAVLSQYDSWGLLVGSPGLGSTASAAAALVRVLQQSAARAFRNVDDDEAQRSHRLALRSVQGFGPVAAAAAMAAASLSR